jgi:hypothetical protein
MLAVERPRTSSGEPRPFTRAQFDALRGETNVFSDAFAQVPDVDSRLDGRPGGGVVPAARAARLDPTQALRQD